jgi:small subunit ribosomal protein S21
MIRTPDSAVTIADGNFEKGIRKFKKKVQASRLMLNLRDRECYVKPTTRRKIKASAARSRWRKYLQSHQLPPKNY